MSIPIIFQFLSHSSIAAKPGDLKIIAALIAHRLKHAGLPCTDEHLAEALKTLQAQMPKLFVGDEWFNVVGVDPVDDPLPKRPNVKFHKAGKCPFGHCKKCL